MRFRLASTLTAAAFSLATVVLFAACSNQGEGEPCSPLNGNQDCNDGLVCGAPINGSATNASDVCCPPPPQQGTAPACVQSGSQVLDGASPSAPDGSTAPEGSTGDAAKDAPTDHAAEAASEAGDGGSEASDGGAG